MVCKSDTFKWERINPMKCDDCNLLAQHDKIFCLIYFRCGKDRLSFNVCMTFRAILLFKNILFLIMVGRHRYLCTYLFNPLRDYIYLLIHSIIILARSSHPLSYMYGNPLSWASEYYTMVSPHQDMLMVTSGF